MTGLEKLQAALDLDVTDETLARVSGMSQQAISKYRNGQSQAENMRFKNALNLINYWDDEENVNKAVTESDEEDIEIV